MLVFDKKTFSILRVNEAAVQSYGYSHEEFLGLTVKDLKPAEDIPALYEVIDGSGPGPERPGVWRHLAKDGQLRWMDIAGHNIEYAGIDARLAIIHDVTETVKLERERLRLLASEKEARLLAENEAASFRALFESAPGKFLVIRASDTSIFAVSDPAP